MRYQQLSIDMECQTADFWCWAAVAQTINRYHNVLSSQGQIASNHTGTPCSADDQPFRDQDCRGKTPCAGKCNSPHKLSEVLRSQGLAVNAIPIKTNPLTFDEVVQRIDAGRPLPLRINIPVQSDGGHFVCIIGYADDGEGNEYVAILDPLVPGKNQGPADVRNILFDSLISGEYPLNSELGIPNFKYYV